MSHPVTTTKLIKFLNAANPLEHISYKAPLIEKDDGKLRPDGTVIKRMRKQRGYSRERLTELTGVAVKTIRNLETKPSYRCYPCTIGILAQHYGVEPSALIQPEDSSGMLLLTSIPDILETKIRIVTSAKSVLACIGSRSRHEDILRHIETTLLSKPELVHYRTMSLPPFKREFQDHLLRMIKIREPRNSSDKSKTLHMGIYDCLVRQSEPFIYANETTALVMLPCVSGVGNHSTAVLFENAFIAQKYVDLAKNLYRLGKVLETERDILKLGLVKEEEHQMMCH
jgi:transcriptional regulator with XRE-family HTH domain